MNEKDFDQQIKSLLNSGKETPPTKLWNTISTQLDQKDSNNTTSPLLIKPRIRFLYLLKIAGVILILSGLFAYWVYQPREIIYLKGQYSAATTHEKDSPSKLIAESHLEETDKSIDSPNLQPLKNLFTKKRNQKLVKEQPSGSLSPKPSNTESFIPKKTTLLSDSLTSATTTAQVIKDNSEEQISPLPIDLNTTLTEVQYVSIPDDIGLITKRQETFGIDNILNFVMTTIDKREEKLVRFSSDDEGIIRLEVNTEFTRSLQRYKKHN